MKFLERLLAGAPVEWKPLGEVAELKRGRVISKEYLREFSGQYPVYSSQTINNGEIGRINTFDFEQEAITWTTDGANAGTVFYREGRFSITNICGLVTIRDIKQLNYRYLYYWLSIEAKKYVYEGMGNPKLMSNQIAKILIPLPPLSVQEEIVRILDKFTELEAELESELEAELEARAKQYKYYRNKLLTFGDEVEWKPLGELCVSVSSGGTPSTGVSEYYNGNIPWLRTQEVDWKEVYDTEVKITQEAIKHSAAKLIPANCVIVAMYGATAAKASINKIPLTTNQACCNLQVDEQIAIYKYVYYWVCREYWNLKAMGEGSQSNLNVQKIKSYPIPLPPLHVQEEIVCILDKFNTLTTSISEGLPREIELRRKQYEYYREKLLTFPRAAN